MSSPVMSLPFPLNPVLETLPVYQPGRPIEEVARELGIEADSFSTSGGNLNHLLT